MRSDWSKSHVLSECKTEKRVKSIYRKANEEA